VLLLLCLFTDLYRAGKDLPYPAKKLLGGLDVKKPREEWPSYDHDDGISRVDYLLETIKNIRNSSATF
jgi:hypothetical protein